tara:strand:- start:83 stop:484 length:402 start_codon:yes stop_codon:yes gene_type:complete
MKITKERLVEIIKEELQNSQISEKFEMPLRGSDEYREMHKQLENEYGIRYEKDEDGRYQRVTGPEYQQMVKDLEELGRPDVIDRLPVLYSISIFKMKQIHELAKAGDMEGLDEMVGAAKAHGQAVVRSGPLGT